MSSIKKEKRINLVLNYVKSEIKKGNFPKYDELHQKFNISDYRITLKDIYPKLGISLLGLPFRRPSKCRQEIRNELINYIKKEVKNGHYPSRRYLDNRFKLRLTSRLFDSIEDLYYKAGIKYCQKNRQELKTKKAKILTEIVISILPKLNLKSLKSRRIYQQGIDIIAIDKNNKIVGIEIKAHNKNEPIKERNIQQLKRFLKKESLHKLLLITTSSKFENHSNINNLEIIDYDKLKRLCSKSQLDKLQFVRNESVHQETKEKIIKKQLILDYAKKKLKQGKDINHIDIANALHVDLRTYFGSINEVYSEAGFLPPINKVHGRRAQKCSKYYTLIVNQMLEYMKKEISKGKYPTGVDVGKKFGIKHIWNFVTMTELYKKLGLPAYHQRKPRFLVTI